MSTKSYSHPTVGERLSREAVAYGKVGSRARMTTRELQRAEARFQRSAERAKTHREQRNAAVRKARAEGWTYARIAEATGLTRGRVCQIAPKHS